MGDKSAIDWCDATWNPIVGCSVVSPGCANCYAMRHAARLEKMLPRERRGEALLPNQYAATTQASKAGPVWTGRINIAPDSVFLAPLRWKRPRAIFVNSMGDLFHETVPDAWIDRVFAVMALAPQHTFIVLTKRAKRMREYLSHIAQPNCLAWDTTASVMTARCPGWKDEPASGPHRSRAIAAFGTWPLPNVVAGVSAERQQEADERIPDLLATPAAKRIVSIEPMLGAIDIRHVDTNERGAYFNPLSSVIGPNLDGVILGGESGPGARPMHPDWLRAIRDQCAAAGVPLFFKQWGEWLHQTEAINVCRDTVEFMPDGSARKVKNWIEFHGRLKTSVVMQRVGKSSAGRQIDGREHNNLPWGLAK